MFQIHVVSVDRKEVDDCQICIEFKNVQSTSDSYGDVECLYYYLHALSLIVRHFNLFLHFWIEVQFM